MGNPMRFTLPLVLMAGLAAGQSPGEVRIHGAPYQLGPVLIVAQANSVPVTVVVRDRNGSPIRGLDRQRFRIAENGRPQAVASFQAETASAAAPSAAGAGAGELPAAAGTTARPRFISLVFDDVNSDKNDLAEARNAAVRFLREQLGTGDHMALFTVSGTQSLGFTQDRAALRAMLAKIAPHPRWKWNDAELCPRINPYEAYLIAVAHDPGAEMAVKAEAGTCGGQLSTKGPRADACGLKCSFGAPPAPDSSGEPIEAQAESTWEMTRSVAEDTMAAVRGVVDYTAQQPGQRIVVLASSGFYSETLEGERDGVIRDALRGGVVINALDAGGLYTEGPGRPLDVDQRILPLATYVFEEVTKFPMKEAQADAMANLAEATGGLYFRNNNDLTLGFERLDLAPSADYALAFTPTPLVRDGKLHALKVELVPPIAGATIEARRGYFAPPPGPTEEELAHGMDVAMRGNATGDKVPAEITVAAEPGQLRVQVRVGVTQPTEKMAMVAGLFAADGAFVTGQRGVMDLNLKKATFDKLRKQGLAPSFVLRAPAGKYRLRVVVQDEANGAVSEFNRQLQVR